MKIKQVFEIDEHRTAIIFNHFRRIRMKLISGELDFYEGQAEHLDIGGPEDESMIEMLGYIQDTKYPIHLRWCALETLTCGEIQRFIAKIDKAHDDGREVHRMIVEQSAAGYSGIFCSVQAIFEQTFHPDEIISHLIMKDIAEYPSVRCCSR